MNENIGTAADTSTGAVTKYAGSCHCGAVRFEAKLDLSAALGKCNCTICTKVSPLGAVIKPAAFRLLSGDESLSVYEWGAKTGKGFFCKHCGVHCYGTGHLAELGGDFVSVNANTLDHVELKDVPVIYWDGRHDNWHAGPRNTPWPILTAG